MKRVVITSTRSHIYDFFLPISAMLWRDRIGYEPVILLVGTTEEWSIGHHRVVIQELEKRNFDVRFVGHVSELTDASVSLLIRQHASAFSDLATDDLMLIGDVDLIPIRREFYHLHDPSKHPIGLYHADMYGDRYWPAYGVSMSVENWREVMGLIPGDVFGSMKKTCQEGSYYEIFSAYQKDYRDSRWWTFDEQYASLKIKQSRFLKDAFRVHSSDKERLGGRPWPDCPVATDYIDCHFGRPGYVGKAWDQLYSILSQLIPNKMSWLSQYTSNYRVNGYQLHTA